MEEKTSLAKTQTRRSREKYNKAKKKKKTFQCYKD